MAQGGVRECFRQPSWSLRRCHSCAEISTVRRVWDGAMGRTPGSQTCPGLQRVQASALVLNRGLNAPARQMGCSPSLAVLWSPEVETSSLSDLAHPTSRCLLPQRRCPAVHPSLGTEMPSRRLSSVVGWESHTPRQGVSRSAQPPADRRPQPRRSTSPCRAQAGV